MKAIQGTKFCFTHSPDTRAQQAQARKAGGHNRHTPHKGDPTIIPAEIGSIDDARTILNYVMAELLAADNSIARNRALLAVHDSFIRSIEIGEIEARLSALEAARK